MFALDRVEACHRRMLALLDLGEDLFERVCIATETPDAPLGYRKPSPRFASELIRDFGFRPDRVCYVGDSASDLAAAKSAGLRGVGVATGLADLRSELRAAASDLNFPVFDSLEEAFAALGIPV